MIRDRRAAIAALTAAGVLWGTTVPLSKLALAWLPPGWLAFTRLSLAALILMVAGRRGLRDAFRPGVLAWGALGYGGTLLLQNAGIVATSVSHAALLIGAAPVLVAVTAALWHRTVARPLAWAGFGVSLAGVGLVAAGPGGSATLGGDGLILGSLVLSATFTVAQSRLLAGRDPVAVTAVQFLAAALAVLPVAALTGRLPGAPPEAGPLLAVAGLIAGGTVLPFTLFAYGQSRVAAHFAGAFLNIEPLVGALAGALFFADPLGVPQLAGGLTILAGIGLSSWRPAGRRGQPGSRGAHSTRGLAARRGGPVRPPQPRPRPRPAQVRAARRQPGSRGPVRAPGRTIESPPIRQPRSARPRRRAGA